MPDDLLILLARELQLPRVVCQRALCVAAGGTDESAMCEDAERDEVLHPPPLALAEPLTGTRDGLVPASAVIRDLDSFAAQPCDRSLDPEALCLGETCLVQLGRAPEV